MGRWIEVGSEGFDEECELDVGASKESFPTGLSKEIPIVSLSGGTPVTGLSGETPTTGLSKEIPITGLNKETPNTALNKETPNTALQSKFFFYNSNISFICLNYFWIHSRYTSTGLLFTYSIC